MALVSEFPFNTIKGSDLPAAADLSGAAHVIGVQDGVTKKIPVALFASGSSSSSSTNLLKAGIYSIPTGKPNVTQRGDTLLITNYGSQVLIDDPVAAGFVQGGLYLISCTKMAVSGGFDNVVITLQVVNPSGVQIGTSTLSGATAVTNDVREFSGLVGLPNVSLAGNKILIDVFFNESASNILIKSVEYRGSAIGGDVILTA